jgi:hypothetical protein
VVDVSNKALSVLLIAAIVVSIGGTMMTLSRLNVVPAAGPAGYLNYQGGSAETNFSINSSLSIYFVHALIPFGTGTVNDTENSCSMGTNNTPPAAPGCIGFNTTVHTQNLTIENNGNLRANVSVNFTGNATTFIGGSVVTPRFMYLVADNESGSCGVVMNGSTFKDVALPYDTAAAGARICTNLNFTDASDTLSIAFYVTIPKDATPGRHNVTITAVACDDGSC